MKCDVLIVGAGIAGLMAGERLAQAGVAVTIVDKGRGVGGRMASRRMQAAEGTARFDHGAQYFTCYSERLRGYIAEWESAGVLRTWSNGFFDGGGRPHFNDVPRYVGMFGMTTIPKYLARDLDVHTGVQVEAIDYDDGYRLPCADGRILTAPRLLLTPPAAQTLALLDSGNVTLPQTVRAELQAIEFEPCFAVLAALDGPSRLPQPGGVWPLDGEPIAWIADNQQKGISSLPALTIHSGAEYARANFEAERQQVAQELLAAAADWIGDSRVTQVQVQRWRYSKPTTSSADDCMLFEAPLPIAIAGDAFQGGRVEGAALSGLAAAERLLQTL